MHKFNLFVMLFLTFALIVAASPIPQIKGWEPASKIETFGPHDLHKYNNGAADQFLAYDFQELSTVRLKSNEATVVLEMYNMRNPLNAFGIYATERPQDGEKYAIGAASRVVPPYQAVMVKQGYYIKINGFEGEITKEVATGLLEPISKSIPGNNALPADLNRLAVQNKAKDSEGFIKKGFLGLEELINCVYANYRTKKGQDYKFFLMVGDSNATSKTWNSLVKSWNLKKKGRQIYLLKEVPYQGIVGITRASAGLIGVSGLKSEKATIKHLSSAAKRRKHQ